jgi:hypothetical protein
MPRVRKLVLAGISVLANVGLQVSGYQNLPLAITLWCIAGALSIWALVTSEPVVQLGQRLLPHFLRPAPATPELGAFDVWAIAPRLGEVINPILRPIRQIEREIAGISAVYRPRIQAELVSHSVSQAAALRVQRIGRQEAREINRRLDRLDQFTPKLGEATEKIVQTFRGMEQRARSEASDRAALAIFRDGMANLVDTMANSREEDEAFRLFMVNLYGQTAELNATSARGAAIGVRLVAALDRIHGACHAVLATADALLRAQSVDPTLPPQAQL